MGTDAAMRARIETPLKRLLEVEGRRQSWLAERVGVDRTNVWGWVHGINVPTPAYREQIARALRPDADDDAIAALVAELWPDVQPEGTKG